MTTLQSATKLEREKRVGLVISFASSLVPRLRNPQDPALLADLQTNIRHLPLQFSPAVAAKHDELDRLGTELWNLSTRLRRDEIAQDDKIRANKAQDSSAVRLLRIYAFLLLDSAGSPCVRNQERKPCIRLMKVALKAAKVCILGKDLESTTRVLERAATYEDILNSAKQDHDGDDIGINVSKGLCIEYFALRTVLAFHQDRLDMAEHMFAKCKLSDHALSPEMADKIADILYEIGKQASTNRNFEIAIKWLERAHDVLGEQSFGVLSPEAGELRLCVMQTLVQAHLKLKTTEGIAQGWHLIKLMEADYGDKLVVSLLKLEMFSAAEHADKEEFYQVLNRMIRTCVLNETNFKTLLHHIHRLKELSATHACNALDDLMNTRLFQEDNISWIEKTVITRIWVSTSNVVVDDALEHLKQLFDAVLQESKFSLSAPATHAAQALLWKQVEGTASGEDHLSSEAWCRLCLHPLLEKAGAQNKVKVTRKIIQSAYSRQDYPVARDVYCKMPESGKDEPVTRYLMYKIGLRSGDEPFAAECLDVVCRNSAKDATLLYACVMEAHSIGNKRAAINALERVLDEYDYTAPVGIHIPALLRVTLRLLQSELLKDGEVDCEVLNQLCAVFEGACRQAKASRRRPNTPEQHLFTAQELEWFSKNSYNVSLKHCAEMPPQNLTRLLNVCIEFIKLLEEEKQESTTAADAGLRLVFCEFLAVCAYTTLARAENVHEAYLQHYLEVRKHCQEFRRAVIERANKLSGSAQDDILSKKLQIAKLELEAALKLQRWDDLEDLFEQCWVCKSSGRYETLADLVLVIHSCLMQANVDVSYQSKITSALQKIVNFASRQDSFDLVKLSYWLRCLFKLTLPYDESISLKCLDQVTQIAAKKHGHTAQYCTLVFFAATPPPSSPVELGFNVVSANERPQHNNCYPATELEWLATTSFNRAVDCYVGNNDAKCRVWAEKAMTVAQWLDDNGRLRDLLMEKFAALQFNV